MVNYKVTGRLVLVEHHTASGAEATYTFTLDPTAEDFNKIAYYLIEMDGGVTAALALIIRFNGISTSTYACEGRQLLNGTETLIAATAETGGRLADATLLSTTGREFVGTIKIRQTDTATVSNAQYESDFACYAATGQNKFNGGSSADDEIDSITIATSTSTWLAGTRITLYKVTR